MGDDDQHRRRDAMRAVFAGLEFPAPLWLLIAQAHSWGAGSDVLDELKRLPDGRYDTLADVLRTLGYPVPYSAGAGPPRTAGGSATSPHRNANPDAVGVGLSRTAQHKIVGEGLAVGLLALGVEAVTINGPIVEAAFRRAWHGWAQHSRFPQVHVDVGRSDILGILRSSGRRQGLRVAEWTCDGQYRPRLCIDASVEQAGRRVGRPARVTHGQWLVLATAFVAQLNPDVGELRYRRGVSEGDPGNG